MNHFCWFYGQVLDFHWHDYQRNQWGKVYLSPDFHNGWNQRWQMDGREVVCKGFARQTVPNLCLDVKAHASNNGAKVGVYQRNGGSNQRWRVQGDNLRLDVFGGESQSGAKVGVYQRNGAPNQRWRFQGRF